MNQFDLLVDECEKHVRDGQTSRAAHVLRLLTIKSIPRIHRLKIANLCRRVMLIRRGLMVLAPIVLDRESKFISKGATPAEIAEYAALLLRVGAVNEAIGILENLNREKTPEANLYLAFCRFALWENGLAADSLRTYLQFGLTPYMSLVGKVNLAAALVDEKGSREECLALLAENIEYAKREGFQRLLGNCYELRAQLFLSERKFAPARSDIDASYALFASDKSLGNHYARKWDAILQGMKSKNPEPIDRFRKEAQKIGHYESVREADLYRLKVEFDLRRFSYLYMGTPFLAYRKRIEKELGQNFSQKSYRFGYRNSKCIELEDFSVDGKAMLKPAKNTHRLVEILLRDFYKPMSLGELFSAVFPQERFDVYHSTDRLHKIIRRARRELKDTGLPITVEEVEQRYRIELIGPIAIEIPLAERKINFNNAHLQVLQKNMMAEKEFSALEGREVLGFSKASFNRFINAILLEGLAVRLYTGPATRYRLTKGS